MHQLCAAISTIEHVHMTLPAVCTLGACLYAMLQLALVVGLSCMEHARTHHASGSVQLELLFDVVECHRNHSRRHQLL